MEPKSVRFIKFHTQLQAREFPGGRGVLQEFLGGDVPLGPLNP